MALVPPLGIGSSEVTHGTTGGTVLLSQEWMSLFNSYSVLDAESENWSDGLILRVVFTDRPLEAKGYHCGFQFAGAAGMRVLTDVPTDAATWRLSSRTFAEWAGQPVQILMRAGVLAREPSFDDPFSTLHRYVWQHLDALDEASGTWPPWPSFTQ